MSNATPESTTKTGLPCPDHRWCYLQGHVDHDEFHSSEIIDLANSDGTGHVGWWAWLVEQRDSTAGTQVVIEGVTSSADPKQSLRSRTENTQISAEDVAFMLVATETPEAYDALRALIGMTAS